MKRHADKVFLLFCIVLSALALNNVYGDNGDLEARAKASAPACASGCTMTRLDRLPWAHDFELSAQGGKTVQVRCARGAVLVGSFSCQPR